MMLTTVTYYVVERDEDERYNHWFDHLVTKANAWWPQPYSLDAEVFDKGRSALKSLAKGEAVSPERMAYAIAYLKDAIAFYENAPFGSVEPFPGRDQLAINDLRAVLEEIDVTVEVPA